MFWLVPMSVGSQVRHVLYLAFLDESRAVSYIKSISFSKPNSMCIASLAGLCSVWHHKKI
jgi:hypothetical protein